MDNVTAVNETAKTMIGLRYPADRVDALMRIRDHRGHQHFSETLSEALDQYIGRELPAALKAA